MEMTFEKEKLNFEKKSSRIDLVQLIITSIVTINTIISILILVKLENQNKNNIFLISVILENLILFIVSVIVLGKTK